MVDTLVDVLSALLLLTGGAFGVLGGLGLLRFPDFYTRLHAAGVTDTLCALLIVAGLALQSGLSMLTLKLALVLLFLLFTAPTASHALARAAMADGIDPESNDDRQDSSTGEPPSNT
jgi:multicomponent Na+:H+ antiporter subunit G